MAATRVQDPRRDGERCADSPGQGPHLPAQEGQPRLLELLRATRPQRHVPGLPGAPGDPALPGGVRDVRPLIAIASSPAASQRLPALISL